MNPLLLPLWLDIPRLRDRRRPAKAALASVPAAAWPTAATSPVLLVAAAPCEAARCCRVFKPNRSSSSSAVDSNGAAAAAVPTTAEGAGPDPSDPMRSPSPSTGLLP